MFSPPGYRDNWIVMRKIFVMLNFFAIYYDNILLLISYEGNLALLIFIPVSMYVHWTIARNDHWTDPGYILGIDWLKHQKEIKDSFYQK